METNDLRELLEQVRAGQLNTDAAMQRLSSPPLADLGYAHVDLHRRERCGFPGGHILRRENLRMG